MSRNADPKPPRPPRRLQVRHLIERVGMINRIHNALRFTRNVEDIHAIILSAMISHAGLDFSRALLLGYDDARGAFRGLDALGAPSREEHDRLHREILARERRPSARASAADPAAGGEEALFGRAPRESADHAFWIATYEKFRTHGDLSALVRQLELPCLPAGPAGDGFLRDLVGGETTLIVPRAQLERSGLPAAFVELLPADSLWAVIRTKRGARLLLIVDRLFDDDPLGHADLVHAEWFTGQVSLALENAEIFQEREQAYNDLRELDQMKSNFLATISHELRTPLTAINGYVQLLMGGRIGPVAPAQKEVLERIWAHADLLTGKVNDLIEIAEIDAGRAGELLLEPVDPLEAIMSVLPRVESRRAHKSIHLEPIVTGPIPRILASAPALERILFHLVDNALKFSHPHGHVWIDFVPVGSELHVRVADDGIGISQGQLRKIFDAFYQVDSQLTRSYEGLGIGLTVIKKQLEITQGRIHVESQPGQGSVFTVIYLLAPSD